jgi:phytoene synthase
MAVMRTAPSNASDAIEQGSKSFASAARLFPSDKRASVHRLYSWCRHCDDQIDGEVLGFGDAPFDRHQAATHLARIRAETMDAIAGRAHSPPFVALQEVIARHAIPSQYPLDLIEGMAIDVEGRPFETIDDTLAYSYHVAGSVGVMMAMILDVRDSATLQRACDLGIAFQLTNIARDVVSDAQRGRTYLPAEWLREEGVDPVHVASAKVRPSVFKVASRMLCLSDVYYQSAFVGIRKLPLRSSWAIASALRIYRGIGEKLAARGAAAWDRRIETGKSRKLFSIGMAAVDVVSGRLMQNRLSSTARDGLWTPSILDAGPRLVSSERRCLP